MLRGAYTLLREFSPLRLLLLLVSLPSLLLLLLSEPLANKEADKDDQQDDEDQYENYDDFGQWEFLVFCHDFDVYIWWVDNLDNGGRLLAICVLILACIRVCVIAFLPPSYCVHPFLKSSQFLFLNHLLTLGVQGDET